jgi:hypothetical protein
MAAVANKAVVANKAAVAKAAVANKTVESPAPQAVRFDIPII